MVPDRDDLNLPTFIQSWIQAASDCAGQCAKLTADLEPLESQGQLITLLQSAAEGVSAGRKALTALGASATPAAVNHVLERVSWRYCLVVVFTFEYSWPGQFAHCCDRFKVSQFVEAWRKHVKVAQNLTLASFSILNVMSPRFSLLPAVPTNPSYLLEFSCSFKKGSTTFLTAWGWAYLRIAAARREANPKPKAKPKAKANAAE